VVRRLLAALLTSRGEAATWLDARSFLRAEDGALVKVDTALSNELLKAGWRSTPGASW
jgi:aspartokinase/homoserine dehydrogenase 2